MTRCFAKILLPTPFHHDSEIAKSVRSFASHTRAACVHWPRDLRNNKENTGRAPEALLEYARVEDRELALRENQARPGEWGFYVAVDKRQADDKRRKARAREQRNPLVDCGEVREPLPDYALAADCADWGQDYWEGKYFDQGFDQGQMLDYDAPAFALPDNVQLHEGVHVPQLQSQPQAFQASFQGRDFPVSFEPRVEPRHEPRRSPIIVVDSAGHQQEMWSFAATHGPPGYGEWSSTVAPRFGPAAEFPDEEEAFLLDARSQAQKLTLECLEEEEALPPLPEPQPMALPTPTRFGFIHYTQHLQPLERRRSRSQPPLSTPVSSYSPKPSKQFDIDAPLPAPASPPRASNPEPETPPRQNPVAVGETPLPMSAKKRRGGRGRAGKPKPE